MDKTCFYVPGSTTITDTIFNGVGRYSGKTLEEIQGTYPGAIVCSMDDAVAECLKATDAAFKKPLTEITEKEYMEWLEVLPPTHWAKVDGVTAFVVSEEIVAGLHTICLNGDDRYWKACDRIAELSSLRVAVKLIIEEA